MTECYHTIFIQEEQELFLHSIGKYWYWGDDDDGGGGDHDGEPDVNEHEKTMLKQLYDVSIRINDCSYT